MERNFLSGISDKSVDLQLYTEVRKSIFLLLVCYQMLGHESRLSYNYGFKQITFSRLSFGLQQSASFRKEQMSQEWSHVNGKFRDLDAFIALLFVHLRFVAMVFY